MSFSNSHLKNRLTRRAPRPRRARRGERPDPRKAPGQAGGSRRVFEQLAWHDVFDGYTLKGTTL
jgi:hypothetical protein